MALFVLSPMAVGSSNVVVMFVYLLLCLTLLSLPVCFSDTSSPVPTGTSPSSSLSASPVLGGAVSSDSSDEVKYVVGILKSAPLVENSADDERKVVMTGKSGKRFLCTIPSGRRKEGRTEESSNANANTLTAPNAASADNTANQAVSTPPAAASSGAAGADSNPPSPSLASAGSASGGTVLPSSSASLAASASQSASASASSGAAAAQASVEQQLVNGFKNHLSQGCFTKSVDYWTYDVCPFSHVHQYHKDGVRKEPLFQLGKYQQNMDIFNTAAAPYIQIYKFGTDMRESRVRFICNNEAAQADKSSQHILLSVSEPKPFKYEFDIKTPLACIKNKPKSKPATAASTGSISVSPSSEARSPASSSASGALPPTSAAAVSSGSAQPTASSASSSSSSPLASVLDILRPLGDDCQHLNNGWWTYKFCHLRSVSQFHKETKQHTSGNVAEASPVITQEYALGYFDKDRRLEELSDSVRIVKASHWENSYVSFMYTSGSNDGCEVAKDAKASHSNSLALSAEQPRDMSVKRRQTEVRVFCSPNEVQPVVRSVSETHTCEYLMVVASELLCHHRDFAPVLPNIQEIVCAPIAEPKFQKI